MSKFNHDQASQLAKAVIKAEANAVMTLTDRIDAQFIEACELLLNIQGRIVVVGVGKSGHIGRKLAATLASTGSAAFFVSAAEALHGDLGMIQAGDVVLILSKSGQSDEIVTLLPALKALGVAIVAFTGNQSSVLAESATVSIDVSVSEEACPLGLAPTTSTAVMLAMGDAMAIALLDAKGFNQEDFARSHPGGNLGKRLLVKISDIMHVGDEIPKVNLDMNLKLGLLEVTSKGLGMVVVVDADNKIVGIFTDGDLRRALDKNFDINATLMHEVMTANCTTVSANQLAAEVLELMRRKRINSFPVADKDNHLIGALNMHDLLQAGLS